MCSITAEVSANPIDKGRFDAMVDELRHRGPDGRGVYLNENGTAALGSRRLSIIDTTEAGDMPLSNEVGDQWIVYNGEIYNFQSIRDELVDFGHEFSSSTDTEVILHAYEEWGTDCVERLRGMFAFAIWDEPAERLFCARDRLGIKPFYYYDTDDRFVLASEMKAIVRDPAIPRRVDQSAVRDFLVYRYIPAPRSIWQDIHKLPPGHLLIHEAGETQVQEYWNLHERVAERRAEGDPEARIEALLEDAVLEHLVSDVPVSVLLSGGLDSSLVTALASRHLDETATYSLGFEGMDDELQYARTVAARFGTNHAERSLESRHLSELLDELMYYYDEPLGDSSIFTTFLLMKAISEDFKVALSGDGGDEVFAGYDWYGRHRLYQRFGSLSRVFDLVSRALDVVPSTLDNRYLDAIRTRLEPFEVSSLDRYRRIMAPRFEPDEARELLTEDLDDEGLKRLGDATAFDSVTDLQRFDAVSFLVDDILVKVDRASMAHSLEVRVPFLDHRLVEYALALDEETLFDGGEQKHLLKRVARLLLPADIVERDKQGFSTPLDAFGFIEDNLPVLQNSTAASDGVLDRAALEKMIETTSWSARDRAKLWLLITFELWYREWEPSSEGAPDS